MKRIAILAVLAITAAGCASDSKKRFTLIVDPPDAQITVLAGRDRPEQSYRSPADISLSVPVDKAEAAKARVEIKREGFKPQVINVSSVQAETVRIRLEKLNRYRLKYRLLRPVASEELVYRDRILAVQISPGERQIDLKILNLTQKPISILWDRAEYTDFMNRQHELMPSGIKPQNRNNPVPPQVIPAGGSLQQAVLLKSGFFYSPEKKEYISSPLFPLDSDAALSLKGRTLALFLPVEMDRAIIPDYNFILEITDVVKE